MYVCTRYTCMNTYIHDDSYLDSYVYACICTHVYTHISGSFFPLAVRQTTEINVHSPFGHESDRT